MSKEKSKIHPQEFDISKLYELYKTLEFNKELDAKQIYALEVQITRQENILRQNVGAASEE